MIKQVIEQADKPEIGCGGNWDLARQREALTPRLEAVLRAHELKSLQRPESLHLPPVLPFPGSQLSGSLQGRSPMDMKGSGFRASEERG